LTLEKRLREMFAGENPIRLQAQARPQAREGARLSILLAEDNAINALLARELLRLRGHAVEHVTTGNAAVEAAGAKRFDLIVMDIHMPGLDGIEAARRIRTAEIAHGEPRAPILALTADVLDAGRKACLEAGMDGFLAKPVDPGELDAVLATLNPPAIAAA